MLSPRAFTLNKDAAFELMMAMGQDVGMWVASSARVKG